MKLGYFALTKKRFCAKLLDSAPIGNTANKEGLLVEPRA
jgi:hypothetical protein